MNTRGKRSADDDSFSLNSFKRKKSDLKNDYQHGNNSFKASARILELPKDIFHLIVGNYLNLKEIAMLDKSIVNRDDRVKYHFLIENVSIQALQKLSSPLQFKWIHSHNIRLERVIIFENKTDLRNFYLLNLQSVRQMILHNFAADRINLELASAFLLNCTSLDDLTLGDCINTASNMDSI